jgi:hypothetical protein
MYRAKNIMGKAPPLASDSQAQEILTHYRTMFSNDSGLVITLKSRRQLNLEVSAISSLGSGVRGSYD